MFTTFFTGPRRARSEPHCAIGPFVVAHVCLERSLIVEVLAQEEQRERQQQRAAFLAELGYTVLRVAPRELRRHPRRVLRRVRAALRPAGR